LLKNIFLIVVTCAAPVLPSGVEFDDGGLSPPYTYRTSITYSCTDSTLVLSDPSLSPAMCGADGQWGEYPTCVGKFLLV